MKTCKICNQNHDESEHYELIAKIKEHGFPTNDPHYQEAHRKANKAEKKRFGEKSYDALKTIDSKLSRHELSGKNEKTGKVEVSKKVPPKYRSEVAYHERVENKELMKKRKK